MYKHMLEEISNFKSSREKDLVVIMKKFFKEKCELENEVSLVYEVNQQPIFNMMNNNNTSIQIDDHFH
jgi:hypothetical protein